MRMKPIEVFSMVGRVVVISPAGHGGGEHHDHLIGGLLKSSTDHTLGFDGWQMFECRVTFEVYQRYQHHPDCAQGGKMEDVLHQHLGHLDYWQPVTVLDFLPEKPIITKT
jgi:hypothetical protein